MNYDISTYDYVASAIGNAYFSGITAEQLWSCVTQAYSVESLDAAIAAQIKLNEIVNAEKA